MTSLDRLELVGPDMVAGILAVGTWHDTSRAISRASLLRMSRDARIAPIFAFATWNKGRALLPAALRSGTDTRRAQQELSALSSRAGSSPTLVLGNAEEMSFGCLSDQPNSLPPKVFGSLVDCLRAFASSQGAVVIAPFVAEEDARMLDSELPRHREPMSPRLRLTVYGPGMTEHLAHVGSRVRTLLGRDKRRFDDAKIRWSEVDPKECLEFAAEGISKVKARHGVQEPVAIARYRLDVLIEDHGSSVRAFRVDVDGVPVAVSVGVMVGEHLDMWEVGLPVDSPRRLEAYLAAVVHAPLECALREGVRSIMLGTGSEAPKTSRGAARENMLGFVL